MKKMIYDFLIKIMTINTLIINISIAIIIILVIIVIIIDIMNIIIINKKNNDSVLQSKLKNIASIIYKIIDNNNNSMYILNFFLNNFNFLKLIIKICE